MRMSDDQAVATGQDTPTDQADGDVGQQLNAELDAMVTDLMDTVNAATDGGNADQTSDESDASKQTPGDTSNQEDVPTDKQAEEDPSPEKDAGEEPVAEEWVPLEISDGKSGEKYRWESAEQAVEDAKLAKIARDAGFTDEKNISALGAANDRWAQAAEMRRDTAEKQAEISRNEQETAQIRAELTALKDAQSQPQPPQPPSQDDPEYGEKIDQFYTDQQKYFTEYQDWRTKSIERQGERERTEASRKQALAAADQEWENAYRDDPDVLQGVASMDIERAKPFVDQLLKEGGVITPSVLRIYKETLALEHKLNRARAEVEQASKTGTNTAVRAHKLAQRAPKQSATVGGDTHKGKVSLSDPTISPAEAERLLASGEATPDDW